MNYVLPVIAGLVMVVVVTTNIVNYIVATAIIIAWITACLWIIQSGLIKSPSLRQKVVAFGMAAICLAFIGIRFGYWALNKYHSQTEHKQGSLLSVVPSLYTVKPGMDESFVMKVTNNHDYPLYSVQVKIRINSGDLPPEDIKISPNGTPINPGQFQLDNRTSISNAQRNSIKLVIFNDNGRIKTPEICLKQEGEIYIIFFIENIDQHSTKSFPLLISKARLHSTSILSFSIRGSCRTPVPTYSRTYSNQKGETAIVIPREGHYETG